MKDLNIEIGQLFDFIVEEYGIDVKDDEFIDIPFKLNLKDEHNNFITASKMIRKKAPLYKTVFDNGIELLSADNHIISIEPQNEISRYTKDFKVGYDIPYLNTKVVSNELVKEDEYVYGVQIESPTHLYKTSDGLIHHNTYTCTKGAKEGITSNSKGAKLCIKTGSIGKSASALIALLYVYRNNWIILMDDNDAFLTAKDEVVQAILKGALDPDTKEIDIPPTQRDRAGNYAQAEMERKGITEGISISINRNKLKENIFSVIADNRLYENYIDDFEREELLALFEDDNEIYRTNEQKKYYNNVIHGFGTNLREDWLNAIPAQDASNASDSNQQANNIKATDGKDKASSALPLSFTFNSSMIFISNLRENQLDTAVLSRCTPFELNLTPEEFIDRLGEIYANLAPLKDYADIQNDLWDWAKKVAYVAIELMVAAALNGVVLFKAKVVLNKKLQFRDLQKLAGDFLILARGYARRNQLNINNIKDRRNIEASVTDDYYRGIAKYVGKAEKSEF